MSDDLVKRLRMDVEPSEGDMESAADLIEAQTARIAELEAALQKIADRTRNAHLLSYAGHMELHEVSRFINDALEGWKR